LSNCVNLEINPDNSLCPITRTRLYFSLYSYRTVIFFCGGECVLDRCAVS